MDYKEKYNKLVEAIKVLQKTNPSDEGIRNWVNDNVPELCKSEDEKIRSFLIDFVKINDGVNISPDYAKKVLAWLEKQGEIDNCPLEGSADCVTTDSRKQGKQTYLDKPELKFHEGDWVVNKLGVAWHIDGFDKKNYQVTGIKGNHNHFPIAKQDEMRHWSIADAKDGDILSNGTMIVIFKQFEEPSYKQHIIAYIGLDNYGDIQVTDGLWELCIDKAKPANKDQRELLFQKMHESGYTFDFKKKELKKLKFRVGDEVITENEESLTITRIDEKGYWSNDLFICGFNSECNWDLVERKPIEWKQENREELTEFENAMMHIGGSFFGENAGLDPNDTAAIKEQAELLLELAPKTEWSEEDEQNLNVCLGYIPDEFLKRWLTNIIHVKHDKTAWNEEDEGKFRDVIRLIEQGAPVQSIRDHYTIWLKSLRPQLRQQWSEEDEKMLDEIIDFFENGTVKLQHDLSLYASWLKSIKKRGVPQPKQEWDGTEIAPPIDSDVCG